MPCIMRLTGAQLSLKSSQIEQAGSNSQAMAVPEKSGSKEHADASIEEPKRDKLPQHVTKKERTKGVARVITSQVSSFH